MYIFYKEIVNYTVKIDMIKKILWSIYIGFAIYCFITLFSGAVGIQNMKALDYFKVNINVHVDELEMKSLQLEDEIKRLTMDMDRLKVAVRPIGYIEKGQKVIKIINNEVKKSLYDIDNQYNSPVFKYNTNQTLLVSAFFAAIIFIMSLLIGVLGDTFKRK